MSQEFFGLFGSLVPESGQAVTVQGEIVRAINAMANDYAANGSSNWDGGYERLSTFALLHLADGTFGPQTTSGVRTDIEQVQKYGRGEDICGYDLDAAFDRLMQAAVEWCQRHPAPITHAPDPELKR